jgi:hypothetical protein
LSPFRGGTTLSKTNAHAVSAAPAELLFFVHVYPGVNIGLCPHSSLGFEEVSCLKALVISPNYDALALISENKRMKLQHK